MSKRPLSGGKLPKRAPKGPKGPKGSTEEGSAEALLRDYINYQQTVSQLATLALTMVMEESYSYTKYGHNPPDFLNQIQQVLRGIVKTSKVMV